MKFQVTDIAQSPSATEIVFDALRRAIVSGDITAGTPLRQEELARAFGCSRIPVREAITRLEQLGLVEARRYKGAVVAGISPQEVDEIFDLRAAVESDAIRRAVPRLTVEALHKARAAHADFAAAPDPAAWMQANRRFHCALYAMDDQRHHAAVITQLLDLSDRYLRAQLWLTDGQGLAVREHADILAACEAGRADTAAQLTHDHVMGSKQALLGALARATPQDAP